MAPVSPLSGAAESEKPCPGKGTGAAAEGGEDAGGADAGAGTPLLEGGGGGNAPTPGLTINECLHFGHLILAPWEGTRESSKLYLASQLGQTIRILTSVIGNQKHI